MDYDSALNEPRTNAEQSETGSEFRVSFESVSYVYFLGAENGLVKIGFASDYDDRMAKLHAGSPVPLIPLAAVRGGRPEERAYHARFKEWKHHYEWFYLTDEIEEEVDRINYELTPNHIPVRFRGCALPLTLTRMLLSRSAKTGGFYAMTTETNVKTLQDPDARWLCAIVDPLTHVGREITDGGRSRVLAIAERLETAINSIWALKELASGLGETLIESEAERLLRGLAK